MFKRPLLLLIYTLAIIVISSLITTAYFHYFGSSIQYVDCSVKSPILDVGIGWLKSM